MKVRGLLAVAAMVAGTAFALLAPPAAAAILLAVALLALGKGRTALAGILLAGALVNLLVVGLSVSGTPMPLAPWLSVEGTRAALVASTRLGAALAVNLAVLSSVPAPALLDDLPLPRRARVLLGAILLAAHDIGRDFHRLRRARMMRGDWPAQRLARIVAAAQLVPLVMLSAHERSLARRDALRVAGHAVGARFVPIVAVAALAAAGRLAFLALPNVALTYVVVFLGGLLFGARAGALGGALGMLLTDFLLTGLHPASFVNVPAMALLGVLGAACRRIDFAGAHTPADRAAGTLLAASIGIACTLAFSALADALTWLLVLRAQSEALQGLVLAGLAFNALPALANGALFALSVGPTVAAFAARRPRESGGWTLRPAPAQEPDASLASAPPPR